MRTPFLLLSLTLFALLAVNFYRDNLFWSPFVSAPSEVATTSARDSAAKEVEEKDQNPSGTEAPAKPAPLPVSKRTETPTKQPSHESEETKPTTEPSLAPSITVATEIEAEILRISNLERAKLNLNALVVSTTLANVAREHSADMQVRDYFEHDTPEGCSSSCRVSNAGYKWQMVGENIYMMSGWRVSPTRAAEMVVNGWMTSPGHRENLLKNGYTESGVGIVIEGNALYATALYAKPR